MLLKKKTNSVSWISGTLKFTMHVIWNRTENSKCLYMCFLLTHLTAQVRMHHTVQSDSWSSVPTGPSPACHQGRQTKTYLSGGFSGSWLVLYALQEGSWSLPGSSPGGSYWSWRELWGWFHILIGCDKKVGKIYLDTFFHIWYFQLSNSVSTNLILFPSEYYRLM